MGYVIREENFLMILLIVSYVNNSNSNVLVVNTEDPSIIIETVINKDEIQNVDEIQKVDEYRKFIIALIELMNENPKLKFMIDIFLSLISKEHLKLKNGQTGGGQFWVYILMAFIMFVNMTSAFKFQTLKQAIAPGHNNNHNKNTIFPSIAIPEISNEGKIVGLNSGKMLGSIKKKILDNIITYKEFVHSRSDETDRIIIISDVISQQLLHTNPNVSQIFDMVSKVLSGNQLIFGEMSFIDRVKTSLSIIGIDVSITTALLSNLPLGISSVEVSLCKTIFADVNNELNQFQKNLIEKGIPKKEVKEQLLKLLLGDPLTTGHMLGGKSKKKRFRTIRRRNKSKRSNPYPFRSNKKNRRTKRITKHEEP